MIKKEGDVLEVELDSGRVVKARIRDINVVENHLVIVAAING